MAHRSYQECRVLWNGRLQVINLSLCPRLNWTGGNPEKNARAGSTTGLRSREVWWRSQFAPVCFFVLCLGRVCVFGFGINFYPPHRLEKVESHSPGIKVTLRRWSRSCVNIIVFFTSQIFPFSTGWMLDGKFDGTGFFHN